MPPDHFAAAPATLRFHDAVFEEHVDEAAFLYGQRRSKVADPGERWDRVAGLEQRLEAHLDALHVGRKRALDVCLAQAASAAPELLFVATCLLCRHGDSASLARLLKNMHSDDGVSLTAVRDALRVECPATWAPFIERALAGRGENWVALLSDVVGCRQLPVYGALMQALEHSRQARGNVAAALGSLHAEKAKSTLWRCLSEDAGVQGRGAALVALLRLGDTGALVQSQNLIRRETWVHRAVGCGGGRLAAQALLRVAGSDTIDPDGIEALGMLGDPNALPALHALLSHEALAPHAACALHWITGAALFEQTFVPDPVDEGTMTAAEQEVWEKNRELPQRSDGRPYGESVRMLSRDPDAWKRWITEHQGHFQPGLRYRSGQLCTPRAIAACLADPDSDTHLRQLAALEIDIRYGCRVPLETVLPVGAQRRAIAQMVDWADTLNTRYVPGDWYFAGHLIDT